MSVQLVLFKINDTVFGLDISHVNIIEKVSEIYKVPDTPHYIDGLINLRGKVHTILNLRKRLGYQPVEHTENTRIIILNHSSMVGLLVDEVFEIVGVEDSDIRPAPELISGLSGKYFNGVTEKDGKLVLIFDLDKIFEPK